MITELIGKKIHLAVLAQDGEGHTVAKGYKGVLKSNEGTLIIVTELWSYDEDKSIPDTIFNTASSWFHFLTPCED